MQILRASNYKVMPWKNGLGSTTEVAISPASDAIDRFDWRVSMAQVTSDGPFSHFPDIDRTLLVLEGDGIDLSVAGNNPARVTRNSVHSFPGDQPTSATLINGPIVDLNIMSRRGRIQHQVQRIDVTAPQLFSAPSLTLLFVEQGVLTLRGATSGERLDKHDALLIGPDANSVMIDATVAARVIKINFW